jgi:hypothetical protein
MSSYAEGRGVGTAWISTTKLISEIYQSDASQSSQVLYVDRICQGNIINTVCVMRKATTIGRLGGCIPYKEFKLQRQIAIPTTVILKSWVMMLVPSTVLGEPKLMVIAIPPPPHHGISVIYPNPRQDE